MHWNRGNARPAHHWHLSHSRQHGSDNGTHRTSEPRLRRTNTGRSQMGWRQCGVESVEIVFAPLAWSAVAQWHVRALHWSRYGEWPEEAGRTEGTDREFTVAIVCDTQAFDVPLELDQSELRHKSDGTEKFGNHFWAVRGSDIERNSRNGRQGHEASVPHRRSSSVECKFEIAAYRLPMAPNLESRSFQYEYFFDNGPLPLVYEHTEPASASTPRSQTNLLLDNVAKIERTCWSRQIFARPNIDSTSDFLIQLQLTRTKSINRVSFLNWCKPPAVAKRRINRIENRQYPRWPPTQCQSTAAARLVSNNEIRWRFDAMTEFPFLSRTHSQPNTKMSRRPNQKIWLTTMDCEAVYPPTIRAIYSSKIRVSDDALIKSNKSSKCNFDDFDVVGSMSLATLIPALEDKFHSMRNSSAYDYDSTQTPNNSTDNSIGTNVSSATMRNMKLDALQPLTMGDENIPYADDSPDQPMIPSLNFKSIRPQNIPTAVRFKSWSTTPSMDVENNVAENNVITTNGAVPTITTTANNAIVAKDIAVAGDAKSIDSMSSDDTDESNTSDLIENQTIRISREMIREMNRILTTLERKATKLNRSLSLNIKYHNSECCCNNVTVNTSGSTHSSCRSIATNRYSLTKDEKTDKNINKKRQIQDINKNNKRYTNRPIKRRHTVGGIPTLIKVNENQYCNKTAAATAAGGTTTPSRRAWNSSLFLEFYLEL